MGLGGWGSTMFFSLSRASAPMKPPRTACTNAPHATNDNGAGIVAHYAVPATPEPAATLVLLRDRPAGGVECLLMRRHLKSKFAAGDFVFPGGKIEADDIPDDAAAWCRGLDVKAAARRLDLETAPRTALGF